MRTGKIAFAPPWIAILLGSAAAQSSLPQSCTVREDRILLSQSGHFRIGDVTASVTLPVAAYASEPASVFLEVSGTLPPGLFLETARERAPLVDGETLHFVPSHGERNEFRLVNATGKTLCSWAPRFRWVKRHPLDRDRGLSEGNFWVFRNEGEPLLLWSVAAPLSDFTLGGIPVRVLSRQQDRVVLRDPNPSIGRRAVASAGASVPLRFIQLNLDFSKRPPKGSAVLRIRVPKLELLTPQILSRARGGTVFYRAPYVMLLNEARDLVELRCGYEPSNAEAFLGDVDLDQARAIVIRPKMIRDGVFTAECPVVFHKEGPVRISAAIVEMVPPN